MFSLRSNLALLFSFALMAAPVHASHVHRSPTAGQIHHRHTLTRRKSRRERGQQAIEPARVMQIQQALIHVRYMSGDPTGKWDAATVAAMQKFQADQGWQTKLMPDSRALEKLGLGPDYSSAINAKTAHFTPPPPDSTIPPTQEAGFTAASGVSE